MESGEQSDTRVQERDHRKDNDGASVEALFEECQSNVGKLVTEYVSRISTARIGDQVACRLAELEREYEKRHVALEQEHAVRMEDLAAEERKFAQRMEAECSKMSFTQNRIRLDVGGTQVSTSKTTLTQVKGSMLEAMFSGRHVVVAEEEGVYFIDRDGRNFHHVLNYLRDGELWTPPGDPVVCLELCREAEFYGLSGLVEILTPQFSPQSPLSCGNGQGNGGGMRILRKTKAVEIVGGCTLTLTQQADGWSAGALFDVPTRRGGFELTVRLHQACASHHIMLGVAPSSIDLERGASQTGACTYYLCLAATPTLHRESDRVCLLNMRSSFQPGDTIKLIYELCDGGHGLLSFAASTDVPVQAFLMPSRTDYAPVVLMKSLGTSVSIVDLEHIDI